jgi:acyl transferase domain-containing protein
MRAMDRVHSASRGPLPADIAVIGIASIFAGSRDTDAFWRMIVSGTNAITEVLPDRWDPAVYYESEPAQATPGRHTVSKWGAFLDPILIDPLRYGVPPSALSSIDPSQLLALEVASRAMRDAGYTGDEDHERTGVVFAAEPGSADDAGLALRGLLPAYFGEVPPEFEDQLPRFTEDTFPGHLANVIAGRVANRLNLGGPNFTVDAACAASLAAVDQACMHLSTAAADLMLCGAVDLHNSIGDFLMFGSVQALSPTGRAAAFDAAADGTTLGEGVACVVLKRLADAERDGDRVYAVIKGVGAASDGRARSLTAPLADGQIRAMRQAYRNAGISPREVGLVEAHGTGTTVGDATELDSLTSIFTEAGARPGGCVLGSVKAQIGHTKCAAGLAGLIKSALAIYYGVQPPTINVTSPSATWDCERSPFAFLSSPRPWTAPAPARIAGVSAFGFGGTNYHVVMSGHAQPRPQFGAREWPAELLCFRGQTRQDAHQIVAELDAALREPHADQAALRDLAARAALRGGDSPVIAAVVARDVGELRDQLTRVLAGEHNPARGVIQPAQRLAQGGGVAFLFPGQGSQRTGSLAELFAVFPELRDYLGPPWAELLFPAAAFDPDVKRLQTDRIRDTRAAQPVLGICGLAVYHLLERLGIRPDMSGGHSYGELVALSVAGAFNARTLLELSTARADAILSAAGEDPGTMAAVTGAADEVAAALADHDVTLANLNAPAQVVISGSAQGVAAAVETLENQGLTAKRLQVACAFHSPLVAGAAGIFAQTLTGAQISAPGLPVWSNRTAGPYPAQPDAIRRELAAQIGSPVRFSDQVSAMYAAGARVFVEVGPGHVLTGLVDATLGERPHLALGCDGPAGQGLRTFLITLAQLACAGVSMELGWLFRGRTEPDRPASTRPLWSVNGHLVRDAAGDYLPGATVPARMIKEFSVSAPKTRDEMLTEYLRASRDMVAAHRDVMLSFLTPVIPAPAPPIPQRSLAPTPSIPQGSLAPTPPIEGVDGTNDRSGTGPGPGPGAVAGITIHNTLLELISERTGYPVDLIEPDLDLEADLSIDSIKRTAIAAEMARHIGLQAAKGDEVLKELVRARTVRSMTQWLEHKAAEVPGSWPPPTPVDGADGANDLRGRRADQAQPPQRLVAGLAVAEGRAAPAATATLKGASFAISGTTPVAGLLAQRLREHGARAETITLEQPAAVDGLILLDGLGEPAAPLPPAMYPLIRRHLTSTGRGWILAAGSRGNPGTAGLAGLFRTIALEYPRHQVRYAEFGGNAGAEDIAGHLLAELLDEAPEPVVMYSRGARHRPHLREEPLHEAPHNTSGLSLDADSVVVMIGGARGVTAWFAGEIARAAAPAIELIGRTALPAEPDSDEIAGAADADAIRAVLLHQGMRAPAQIERATRKILAHREITATMTELREHGARVRYHCADATDEAAIGQVLKQVHTEHGRIDGLVFAAGIIEDRLIADKEPASFDRVFTTKVSGATIALAALDELGCTPRFVVLYGSTAATFGSRGQADYAAANDALEAIGSSWAWRTGGRCLTVHWGPWAPAGTHKGMVTADLAAQFGDRGIGLIDPGSGARSLLDELAFGDRGLTSVVYTAPMDNGS